VHVTRKLSYLDLRTQNTDRVRTLGFGVLEDIDPHAPTHAENASLRDRSRDHGPACGGYHRLCVATLTDDLGATAAAYDAPPP